MISEFEDDLGLSNSSLEGEEGGVSSNSLTPLLGVREFLLLALASLRSRDKDLSSSGSMGIKDLERVRPLFIQQS